jgi:hypothetical protein
MAFWEDAAWKWEDATDWEAGSASVVRPSPAAISTTSATAAIRLVDRNVVAAASSTSATATIRRAVRPTTAAASATSASVTIRLICRPKPAAFMGTSATANIAGTGFPVMLPPATKLSYNESTCGGYTHKCSIKASDLRALPNSATSSQSFSFSGIINVGEILTNTAICVVAPFTFSDGSIVSGKIAIGDGSQSATFMGPKDVLGVAPGISYASSNLKAYAAFSSINFTFSVTSGKQLNTATAGEAHIFWKEFQLGDISYPK